jgi:hypothetical protein
METTPLEYAFKALLIGPLTSVGKPSKLTVGTAVRLPVVRAAAAVSAQASTEDCTALLVAMAAATEERPASVSRAAER